MKYIDHIAYPIMIAIIYVLVAFVKWDHDPANWDESSRIIWIIWGTSWGYALRMRISREQGRGYECH